MGPAGPAGPVGPIGPAGPGTTGTAAVVVLTIGMVGTAEGLADAPLAPVLAGTATVVGVVPNSLSCSSCSMLKSAFDLRQRPSVPPQDCKENCTLYN